MSSIATEYETLLREAVSQAKHNSSRAVEDLFRFSSSTADAVAKVTAGQAVLELIAALPVDGATSTFQLQLSKVGGEAPPSDLGIYNTTEAGYPILRWYSRKTWESNRDVADQIYRSSSELEEGFKSMIANPESRLVVLVSFFQSSLPS